MTEFCMGKISHRSVPRLGGNLSDPHIELAVAGKAVRKSADRVRDAPEASEKRSFKKNSSEKPVDCEFGSFYNCIRENINTEKKKVL